MSTQAIPNLIQGVSQQAAQQRRDSQCESQYDCFNSVADGAAARPQANLVKAWAGRSLTGAFFSEIVRGNNEDYLLGVHGSLPFAINLSDGTDCAIVGDNLDGYLTLPSGETPRDQIRAQVVEDTTFFINRTIKPAIDPDIKSAAQAPAAIVFVRGVVCRLRTPSP